MKTVLIIEDEHNIAEAEKLILQDEFKVHVANDGETGLKLAKQLKPDLIVLDLMLPGRNGYDVCYALRENDELTKIKVLMVTAKNQKLDEDKGLFIGADHYLTKPFDPDQLKSKVKELLKC